MIQRVRLLCPWRDHRQAADATLQATVEAHNASLDDQVARDRRATGEDMRLAHEASARYDAGRASGPLQQRGEQTAAVVDASGDRGSAVGDDTDSRGQLRIPFGRSQRDAPPRPEPKLPPAFTADAPTRFTTAADDDDEDDAGVDFPDGRLIDGAGPMPGYHVLMLTPVWLEGERDVPDDLPRSVLRLFRPDEDEDADALDAWFYGTALPQMYRFAQPESSTKELSQARAHFMYECRTAASQPERSSARGGERERERERYRRIVESAPAGWSVVMCPVSRLVLGAHDDLVYLLKQVERAALADDLHQGVLTQDEAREWSRNLGDRRHPRHRMTPLDAPAAHLRPAAPLLPPSMYELFARHLQHVDRESRATPAELN